MAKDYYLFMPCDNVMLGHDLTLAEAEELKAQLDAEYPDEAGQSVIGCITDDPLTAARRAFAHMLNW